MKFNENEPVVHSLSNIGRWLRVGLVLVTLTLTACGGDDSSPSVASKIQALVATGSAVDYQTAMDLFLANMDTLSASDLQAAMDALLA